MIFLLCIFNVWKQKKEAKDGKRRLDSCSYTCSHGARRKNTKTMHVHVCWTNIKYLPPKFSFAFRFLNFFSFFSSPLWKRLMEEKKVIVDHATCKAQENWFSALTQSARFASYLETISCISPTPEKSLHISFVCKIVKVGRAFASRSSFKS